jgi:hypothetical protein
VRNVTRPLHVFYQSLSIAKEIFDVRHARARKSNSRSQLFRPRRLERVKTGQIKEGVMEGICPEERMKSNSRFQFGRLRHGNQGTSHTQAGREKYLLPLLWGLPRLRSPDRMACVELLPVSIQIDDTEFPSIRFSDPWNSIRL